MEVFVLLAPLQQIIAQAHSKHAGDLSEYNRSRTPLEICTVAWNISKPTLQVQMQVLKSLSQASMIPVQIVTFLAKGHLWWPDKVINLSATDTSILCR